jgi:hypothetical protein
VPYVAQQYRIEIVAGEYGPYARVTAIRRVDSGGAAAITGANFLLRRLSIRRCAQSKPLRLLRRRDQDDLKEQRCQKQYESMKRKFAAENRSKGMSPKKALDEAQSKAAAIFNSTHKDNPVTGKHSLVKRHFKT